MAKCKPGCNCGKHSNSICSILGCERPVRGWGWCRFHYDRWRKHGDPLTVKCLKNATLEDYLDHYTGVLDENGHRLWSGPVDDGYPCIKMDTRGMGKLAHRVVYMLDTGDHLFPHQPVHHKCGVKLCVEVTHLQKTTWHENTAEMLERNYYLARITELEAENAELKEQLETRSLQYVC